MKIVFPLMRTFSIMVGGSDFAWRDELQKRNQEYNFVWNANGRVNIWWEETRFKEAANVDDISPFSVYLFPTRLALLTCANLNEATNENDHQRCPRR